MGPQEVAGMGPGRLGARLAEPSPSGGPEPNPSAGLRSPHHISWGRDGGEMTP